MSKVKDGNWFKRHKVLTVLLALIVIGVIANAGSGDKSKSTSTNNSTSSGTSSKTEPASAEEKKPDVPAEYKSALTKAKTYSDTMNMSKQGIYDQLTSDYGEKFTPAAAQYAVDNLKADYNANALAKAKTYQKTMSMSPSAIHDQLTSAAGEKFTTAEADYAIAHLND